MFPAESPAELSVPAEFFIEERDMVSFVDTVTLHLRAGKGGNGCVSVHREKFKPLGGPDGGNGCLLYTSPSPRD